MAQQCRQWQRALPHAQGQPLSGLRLLLWRPHACSRRQHPPGTWHQAQHHHPLVAQQARQPVCRGCLLLVATTSSLFGSSSQRSPSARVGGRTPVLVHPQDQGNCSHPL
jgi:hypothetical protein